MKVLTLGLACAAMISLAALAPAGAAETIKIGIGPVTGVGPVFLAQDRGYFAAENLDADAISFDAAQQVAQGVVSGAAVCWLKGEPPGGWHRGD